MAQAAKRRVFISYARKDGAELAQRLERDLHTNGFDAWLDVQRLRGGTGWTSEIESAVDRCDALVALMTPGSYASDICRAEQLRALRKERLVVPVLAAERTDIPLHLETRSYRNLTKHYGLELKALVEDLRLGRGAVVLAEQYRNTYVTAPPLPRNYVERPEELARLRDVLLVEDSGASIALTALRGMGGIGKTILAQAMAHDEVVQQAFPDGVVWTSIGNESAHSLTARMQEVRRALQDEPGDKETDLECINRYRTVLKSKAALVIVDDVWRVEDIEPFLADSARSRLLFTTRDGSIASAAGADEHVADLLSEAKSRELLAQWAGLSTSALPAEAAGVICECGRLPLALAMIGAMLRGKPSAYWGRVLELLRRADLEKFGAISGYRHKSLMRAMGLSLESIDPQIRERYLSLAVMLEDMPVQPLVQQTLWNLDAGDALDTAELFVSLSLAQRDGTEGAIRLHDLQLDYARAQWQDKKSLALIHGAMRLSAHVIERDAGQFVSQMVGRLAREEMPDSVREFAAQVTNAAPRPWLRPLRPGLHPPGTALLRTLAGHSRYVMGVAVTSDGRRAISASWDRTLKVWDLDSGRELRTLAGHFEIVTGVAATPDGRRAVSACLDGTLKVWDLDSGRELRTLRGHSSAVYGVAVAADDRRAVSASHDQTLKVWDLDSGRELRTFRGHSGSVSGVAVTLDGRRAVSASWDRSLKVWDLDSGRELRTLAGHSEILNAVALTADGRQAVSASKDRTLKVWDLDSGRELSTLEGHSDSVYDVAVTTDGRRAVSASLDQTLKVWDLESGREIRTFRGHSDSVYGVAMTPDGRRAVSASGDQTLKVWDLDSDRDLRTAHGHAGSVYGVAATSDGRRGVSASSDYTLKVWDLEMGCELRTFGGHSSAAYGVAVTPDGACAVSASEDQTLKVWGVDSGCELHTLRGHSDLVNGVAVTKDGGRAVSASFDCTLKVWDLVSGRELLTLAGHSYNASGVAVTGDGRRAVSASEDRTLKVWDLDSGCELRTLEGHSDSVYSVAVTPDGRWAVSASYDQTLKVWDLDSGCELRTLEGHSDSVRGVAVTPDGRRAVSASYDRTLKVWDLDSSRTIATFTCDARALCCAVIDNQRIIAGDEAGHIHILTLEL